MGLFDVINLVRRSPKKCSSCGEKYTSKNLLIPVSDLKWEQKEKREEKTTRGALDAVGGINYIQFTRYKIYYRRVIFSFKCPKCGTVKNWATRYDLYDGRCGHSQSGAEELRILKKKISKTLGPDLWNNGAVKMVVSHEI